VQEEAGVVTTEKLLDHFLGLTGAALHVYRLEDGHDVFEQILGLTGPALTNGIEVVWGVVIRVEKSEDA
jgi:hypothetical protein